MEARQLELRLEVQSNPIADIVSALMAVVRPILLGTLYALKRDIVEEVGGHDEIKLKLLPRLYRRGDGDCGLCFEYAVHDALNRQDSMVLERICTALSFCGLQGHEPTSILFGAEKAGALQLIDTARDRLTDESVLMYGSRGRPAKLKRHIDQVAAAFRKPDARAALPHSISGLWKADLFTGFIDSDRWVGTSVKINPQYLEPARGLRIGIVPIASGFTDRIELRNNLVVCPLPYDGSFMEVFYRAWTVVQHFIAADARMPRPVDLPGPEERRVANYLEERREFAVVDVAEALVPLAQPGLLATSSRLASIQFRREADTVAKAVLAPVARPRIPVQLDLLDQSNES